MGERREVAPMTYHLRHIDVLRFALVTALLYAVVVLAIAIFAFLMSLLFAAALGPLHLPYSPMGMGPTVFSPMMFAPVLLIAPVIYAVISFVLGALVAMLYNLIAGWTGGFRFTLENDSVISSP